ncbi:hypothetical protein A4X13_0g3527 [Tilletia indica]|uniref:Uncharacterized protein n=1 Tax=Tilletia indica TaxID=43049 RepID=A0A177TXX0_9BASI|nr:hypothetical protein A4X13_0g3527 [Tilletia indica]
MFSDTSAAEAATARMQDNDFGSDDSVIESDEEDTESDGEAADLVVPVRPDQDVAALTAALLRLSLEAPDDEEMGLPASTPVDQDIEGTDADVAMHTNMPASNPEVKKAEAIRRALAFREQCLTLEPASLVPISAN